MVDGVTYYLLDHPELFDGLYWGYRSNERIRRRIALARAAAEVIASFQLHPLAVATNDAAAALISGIVRADPYYAAGAAFARTSFVHIIHNGGWQYFDCYDRYEDGVDLFALFNLPGRYAPQFTDPRDARLFNLMAAGIRFADRVITVSPSYAAQIEQHCDGLETAAARRGRDQQRDRQGVPPGGAAAAQPLGAGATAIPPAARAHRRGPGAARQAGAALS